MNKKTYMLQLERLSELNKKLNKMDINDDSKQLISTEINIVSSNIITLSKEIKFTESIIDKLNQPSKLILIYKYEKNFSIGEIAKELSYSTKRIYQLHMTALHDFDEELLNTKEKGQLLMGD